LTRRTSRNPDAQHPFLDLAQLAPVHVLEQDGLADPQRLSVELEHPLATVIFDHIVIADRDHALAHLVPRGATAFAALAAFLPSPSAEHRRLRSSGAGPLGWPLQPRPA
jgi:hypothetical protein